MKHNIPTRVNIFARREFWSLVESRDFLGFGGIAKAPLVTAACSYFCFSPLFSLAYTQVCFVVVYERNNI